MTAEAARRAAELLPRQKFNCATFAKVAKATMFVYSAARKGKRMERLSLKAEETLWLYPCQFQAAR